MSIGNTFPSQPLSGTTIGNYIQLLKTNRFDVDFKYLPRVLYTILVSATTTTPLSGIEKALKRKATEKVKIKKDPIFIIGHWRTGTTFLHYLMSKDKSFGFISNAQSFYPRVMFPIFPKLFRAIIRLHIPEKRPMDDMSLTLDTPQEEEFALGNMGIQSAYHWWTFPKRMTTYFEKYVLLNGISSGEYLQFRATYLRLLKKITLANKGKRLLIKNPINTGRIPFLLELFPNARFIYLHRDPFEVYHSTVKLHTKLLECFSFQHFDKKEVEINTVNFYNRLLHKYELDKKHIPKNNLIEVGYGELIKNPLKTVQKIYTMLRIPTFEPAKEAFQRFISAQKDYKADIYAKSPPIMPIYIQNMDMPPSDLVTINALERVNGN